MQRKWILGALCGAVSIAGTAAQAASGGTPGWYGDIDLGRAHSGLNGADADRAFASQGISGTTSIDRNRTAWGLNLGYRFSRNWALEGGYANFGKFALSTPTTVPGADVIQGSYKAHAWSFSPLGILPLNDQWALFGKAGLTRNTLDLSATSATGVTAPASASRSNTGWLLGGGTTYEFTRNLYGRAEFDRYSRLGDAGTTGRGSLNLFTLGLGLRF